MKPKKLTISREQPVGPRPPFREWLIDRIGKYATLNCLGEQREPRDEDEEREIADKIRSIWQRCQILTYKPHAKQALFHGARKAQLAGSFARNQGGKTTSVIVEILSWGFGEDLWTGAPIDKIGKTKWRPGMRFFIGAKDYNIGINEVIIPKMLELLPLEEMGVEFIKMQGRVTHKLRFPEPYNFTIKMLSYEQDALKSEGTTWNGGLFDEPPPRHLYVSCRRGCMRHAAPIRFSATPLNEPWMYDEIFCHKDAVHLDKPEDLKKIRWDTPAIVKIGRNDNPYISEEQMAAYEATLDEEEKQARIYGEFLHLTGRVYKGFDRGKHVLDRDKLFTDHPNWREYPAFQVIDPHDRKPFAIGWGICTPRDEVIFVDEWPNFDFARQKSWKWSTSEYVEMMRDREMALWGFKPEPFNDRFAFRFIDPRFGVAPKAGSSRSLIEEFGDHGIHFDVPPGDEIEEGHIAVKTDLHNARLFFTSNCMNHIKAMENYTWDEYTGKNDRAPKERPKDKFKDFADVVRYAVKGGVRYYDPKTYAPRAVMVNNGIGF